MKTTVKAILFGIVFPLLLLAAEPVRSISSVEKLAKSAQTSDIWLGANRMNGIFRNNGTWFYDNVMGDWGLEWPKGSDLSPIFGAGQFLCATIDGEIRVAGVQHSATEYQSGLILTADNADDKNDTKYRWYELHKDGSGDWSDWPVSQGAPFDEKGDPLLLGDVTIYSVWNDLFEYAYGYDELSLNAEIHQLAWAYDRSDAFGDMIFQKWTIVNKSGKTWDDACFAIWCDPDIGNAGDDYVGCDTTLGLGYCYNADDNDDNQYKTSPPAVGFNFFQGPIVPSTGNTVSLPDGTLYTDSKMLGMTSFVFYTADDSPQGNPHSALDIYYYLHGLWMDGSQMTEGGHGTDPSNPPTKFMFSGDPETGTGWLDSDPADRRFFMVTGPFTLETWIDSDGDGVAEFGEPGTQEIVAAVMVARGTSNLNSVTKLKQISILAQSAYDRNFEFSMPPQTPSVEASALPNEIILTWDERSEYNADGSLYSSTDPGMALAFGDTIGSINYSTQVIDDSTYNFYRYVVYQYSDNAGSNPCIVDYFNIGKNKDAIEYSKQRFIRILTNRNSAVGTVGDTLINGKEYYFGVVAEGYLEDADPQVISSDPAIVSITPRFMAGVRYTASYNDTLEVTHSVTDESKDLSGGSVTVWVVDPSKTTGLDYTVSFNDNLTWNLSTSDQDTVLVNQTNQNGDDAYNIADGLIVKVEGGEPGIDLKKDGPYGSYEGHMGYEITGGTRWVGWPVDWGLETMGGSFGTCKSLFEREIVDYVNIEIRFAGIPSWPQSDSSAAALMAASKAAYPDRWQKAVVYWRPGYEVQSTLGDVPFTVWDLESNPSRQLKVAFCEDPRSEFDGAANLIWDMGWGDDKAFGANGGHEYVFFLNDTYDEEYTDYLNGTLDGTYDNVMYNSGWGRRSTYPFLKDAFEFQIYASNPNTPYDIFTFTSPDSAIPTKANLKEDLKKINVVPNPYYGYHSGDINDDRWVRFTFLPEECMVKIFDLAGHLIRQLEKTDATTPFLDWDLTNQYGVTIASGIYIYHVKVPGIGEKVGKMAVFISEMK